VWPDLPHIQALNDYEQLLKLYFSIAKSIGAHAQDKHIQYRNADGSQATVRDDVDLVLQLVSGEQTAFNEQFGVEDAGEDHQVNRGREPGDVVPNVLMQIVDAQMELKERDQAPMVVKLNIQPIRMVLDEALQEQNNGVVPAEQDELVNEIASKAVLQQHPVEEDGREEVGLVPQGIQHDGEYPQLSQVHH